VSRQIGVCRVAEDLAVDLQIRPGPAFLPPERVLAECAVLRLEVFLPQRGRLDEMAITVEYREIPRSHSLPPARRA
jgi:hypothetical protein